MITVVFEGVVERFKFSKRDHREQRVSYQCQVFGSFGISFRGPVLSPEGGVALPMVEVLHTPVLADHFTDLGRALAAIFMGASKEADRHFGLFSFFGRAVKARAFDDQCNVWKGTDLGIHCYHRDISNFKSPMASLEFAH